MASPAEGSMRHHPVLGTLTCRLVNKRKQQSEHVSGPEGARKQPSDRLAKIPLYTLCLTPTAPPACSGTIIINRLSM